MGFHTNSGFIQWWRTRLRFRSLSLSAIGAKDALNIWGAWGRDISILRWFRCQQRFRVSSLGRGVLELQQFLIISQSALHKVKVIRFHKVIRLRFHKVIRLRFHEAKFEERGMRVWHWIDSGSNSERKELEGLV